MKESPRGQSFFKLLHDAPETQRLNAQRGDPANDSGLQLSKECVLVHSTLFDDIHLVNKDAYIANLKASGNYDTAKIQSDVYGSWVRGARLSPLQGSEASPAATTAGAKRWR